MKKSLKNKQEKKDTGLDYNPLTAGQILGLITVISDISEQMEGLAKRDGKFNKEFMNQVNVMTLFAHKVIHGYQSNAKLYLVNEEIREEINSKTKKKNGKN